MVSRIRSNFGYSIGAVLLLGVFYTGFSTKIGLHCTMACLQYFMPGRLTIIGLEGSLLGKIKARRIHYEDAQRVVKANDFYIHWKKSGLLKGQFLIQALHIKDLIIATKSVQTHEPFHVPNFVKRIRLKQAKLINFIFKMDNFALQGQGTLGLNGKFKWTLQYKNPVAFLHKNHILQLHGSLTGNSVESFQLELEGASQKKLIWIAPFLKGSLKNRTIKLPPFHIKSQFKAQTCMTELKFIHQNKTQAAFTFTILSPQRLLENLPDTKKTSHCDIHLLIKDWSIIKNIALLSENLLLTDVKGPLMLKCHLETTGYVLRKWLTEPKQQLLDQCQSTVLPITPIQVQLKPQFSVLWQQAVAPNVGITLKEYNMTACLRGNQILWYAHAIAPTKHKQLSNTNVGKWQLRGTTQYNLNQLSGKLPWWQSVDFKHEFTLQGTPIPWFANTNYVFWAAPNLHLQAQRTGASLLGSVQIPRATFKFQDTDANSSLDKDVQFADRPRVVSPALPLAVKVGLSFGKAVYFEYEGAKARLEGSIKLRKARDEPSLSAKGVVRFAEGYYCAGEQKLLISPDSKFVFKNAWRTPQMDIKASQAVRIHPRKYMLSKLPMHTLQFPWAVTGLWTYTGFIRPIKAAFGLHLSGNTENPELRLFTNPPQWISQPREDITDMLTGQPVDRLSIASVPILLNAMTQLTIGYTGYKTLLSNINKPLGLSFEVKADEALEKTHFLISKAFTQKFSVSAQLGLQKSGAKFDYLLNENLMIQGSASHLLGSGLDLVYQREHN